MSLQQVLQGRGQSVATKRSAAGALVLVFFGAVFLGAGPDVGLADETGAAGSTAQLEHSASTGGTYTEEVTVTAQRREEAERDVPLSVDVVEGDELDVAGIRSTRELEKRSSGLAVSTNAALGAPYIRGIGSEIIGIGGDSSVAVYVDDVYRARPVGALFDLFDVDRVEILKGPQGTLYGRNATGGTIRVINHKPVSGSSAEASIDVGEYENIRFSGHANLPLQSERTFLRVSYLRHESEGWARNLVDDDRIATTDVSAGRVQLRHLSRDGHWDILLSADARTDRSTRFAYASLDPDDVAPGTLFGGRTSENPRAGYLDLPPLSDLESGGASLGVTGDFPGFRIESTTAFRRSDYLGRVDLDSTDADFSSNSPLVEESEAVTQEFQLTSTAQSRTQWLAGAFYLREDAHQSLNVRITPASLVIAPDAENETRAWAVFGQVSHAFSDSFRAALGARYSWEEKAHVLRNVVNDALLGIDDDTDDWDAVTPRLTVEYRHEGTMYYATASRGFKSGGYNSNQSQPGFGPEYVWSYELGAKSSLSEGRALLAVAAFHSDFEDIQLNQQAPTPGAFPQVVNAGEARIRGLEASLRAQVRQTLEFEAGATYLDAEFEEFVSVNSNEPANDPDRSGNNLPRAPELSAFASATYTWPISDLGRLRWNVGVKHQSEVFFDPYEDPLVSQKAYELWSTEIAYESSTGRTTLAVYGRNLGDETYKANVIRNVATAGTLRFLGPPRVFGVRAAFRF